MAAPESVTLRNLNGKWTLNKNMSFHIQELLKQQDVGFILRNIVNLSSVHLDVKTSTIEGDVLKIEIDQRAGPKSTNEKRHTDYQWRDHYDILFGNVKGRTRLIKWDEVEDEELRKAWGSAEGEKHGWHKFPEDQELLQSYVESTDSDWIANQIWGFDEIDGERRHVRVTVIRKGTAHTSGKLVYDYDGK
ncbi:MAG: hypothetical protein M1822_002295 [Bathelium mastoideum]|nr:MAG: hypothetical protein M1822_002295 [Bathelium mastoideum]